MISITPEGVVLKDGEELGRIDGDTMTHHVPVGGVVKGQIRKEAGKPELQFVAAVAVDLGPKPDVTVISIEQLQSQAASPGLTIEKLQAAKAMLEQEEEPENVEVAINPISLEQLQAEAAKLGLTVISPSPGVVAIASPAVSVKADDIVQPGRPPRPALERMLTKAQAGEIPQPPLMGSEGDKTPAFIRWFKEYATPEEFEIQYGGRKYSLDPAPKQSTRLPGEFYES